MLLLLHLDLRAILEGPLNNVGLLLGLDELALLQGRPEVAEVLNYCLIRPVLCKIFAENVAAWSVTSVGRRFRASNPRAYYSPFMD